MSTTTNAHHSRAVHGHHHHHRQDSKGNAGDMPTDTALHKAMHDMLKQVYTTRTGVTAHSIDQLLGKAKGEHHHRTPEQIGGKLKELASQGNDKKTAVVNELAKQYLGTYTPDSPKNRAKLGAAIDNASLGDDVIKALDAMAKKHPDNRVLKGVKGADGKTVTPSDEIKALHMDRSTNHSSIPVALTN